MAMRRAMIGGKRRSEWRLDQQCERHPLRTLWRKADAVELGVQTGNWR